MTTESCNPDDAINAGIAARTAESLRSIFEQFFKAVSACRARIRARRELAEYPDHILKDIGISRADVYRETTKPFWRD